MRVLREDEIERSAAARNIRLLRCCTELVVELVTALAFSRVAGMYAAQW
jgi:hypothetical protein